MATIAVWNAMSAFTIRRGSREPAACARASNASPRAVSCSVVGVRDAAVVSSRSRAVYKVPTFSGVGDGAAVHLVADQSAQLEDADRFADGVARHFQLGGDRALAEPVAGGEGAGQDPFGQAVGHLLGGGGPAHHHAVES